MPASKTQLIGGNFQDAEGNVLANGYLEMELSQDATVTSVGNVAAGITIRIALDSNGSIVQTPAQYVWGNDNLLPVNTFYRVTGYTVLGQPAWGPNNQQVIGASPFDVGTWVPNQVISWVPSVQGLLLETNGTSNQSQALLDFVDTASVTWANTGGQVKATAAGGVSFENNSTPNTSQAVLNFEDTASVTWANP